MTNLGFYDDLDLDDASFVHLHDFEGVVVERDALMQLRELSLDLEQGLRRLHADGRHTQASPCREDHGAARRSGGGGSGLGIRRGMHQRLFHGEHPRHQAVPGVRGAVQAVFQILGYGLSKKASGTVSLI